jgi:hypothetical protein
LNDRPFEAKVCITLKAYQFHGQEVDNGGVDIICDQDCESLGGRNIALVDYYESFASTSAQCDNGANQNVA